MPCVAARTAIGQVVMAIKMFRSGAGHELSRQQIRQERLVRIDASAFAWVLEILSFSICRLRLIGHLSAQTDKDTILWPAGLSIARATVQVLPEPFGSG